MADVTGPISSLPGTSHVVPPGTMCDDHPDVPAVSRIQGETDSMGCEMYDLCQACLEVHKAHQNEDVAGRCDWCKKDVLKLLTTRDYDEGTCGPVYMVCEPCIDRQKRLDEAYLSCQQDDNFWDDE